jgi:hypothetical protein
MADTTNRLAGVAYLSVDGQSYMLAGELSYSTASYARDTKGGQDKIHGYSEKPRAPYIVATLRDAGSLTLSDFNDMTKNTITLELANGKTVIGRDMWTVDAQEVKTEEGTFEVRWEGFTGAVTEQTT